MMKKFNEISETERRKRIESLQDEFKEMAKLKYIKNEYDELRLFAKFMSEKLIKLEYRIEQLEKEK